MGAPTTASPRKSSSLYISGLSTKGHNAVDPHHVFGDLTYKTLMPLSLIVFSPVFVVAIIYTNLNYHGSLSQFLHVAQQDGFVETMGKLFPSPSAEVWGLIGTFMAFEAALILLLPGKIHKGPVTASGHVPVYTANGFQAFTVTMITVFIIQYFGFYDLARVYDLFHELIVALSYFALSFCAFLVLKGIVAPSSTDNQVSGNPIFDFFWGVELYPRLGNLDFKTLVNCRTAMMGWPILLICFLLKQRELANGHVTDTMYVSVGIQLVYIAKFFWWETGYFDSIDIMHDRFGFYICWGCLNWLPSLYTNCTFYLVSHRIDVGTEWAALIFAAGILAVYINYSIDEERQRFRKTNGNTLIWGKKPEYIEAIYKTSDGEERRSKLLVSGWWGLSRHFNYVAELSAALLWSPPVQTHDLIPYGYFIFLVILLVHRAFRDEIRCAKKYGKYFDEYKARVPYRMIPGIL